MQAGIHRSAPFERVRLSDSNQFLRCEVESTTMRAGARQDFSSRWDHQILTTSVPIESGSWEFVTDCFAFLREPFTGCVFCSFPILSSSPSSLTPNSRCTRWSCHTCPLLRAPAVPQQSTWCMTSGSRFPFLTSMVTIGRANLHPCSAHVLNLWIRPPGDPRASYDKTRTIFQKF